jgi:hypothetical protein
MKMRQLAVLLGFVLASFALVPPARAGIERIDQLFRAHHLAGVVVDPNGEPVPDVVIEECDAILIPLPTWSGTGERLPDTLEPDCFREPKHILRSTTTDANGHFAFPNTKAGTTHYLHLYSRPPGFDPMMITVKLRLFARAKLLIKLTVAT